MSFTRVAGFVIGCAVLGAAAQAAAGPRQGRWINGRERRGLEKDLDKTSCEIYRAKHSDRTDK